MKLFSEPGLGYCRVPLRWEEHFVIPRMLEFQLSSFRLGRFESWLPPLAGAGIFRLALASACKFRRKRDQALDLS
jgi:hypothetical protein